MEELGLLPISKEGGGGEATLAPVLSTSSPSCLPLWATLDSFFLPMPAHWLSLDSSQAFTFLSYPSHQLCWARAGRSPAHIYTHTCAHTHVCAHTHMCAHMCAHTCACAHAHTCTHPPPPLYTSHPHHSDHCSSLEHF